MSGLRVRTQIASVAVALLVMAAAVAAQGAEAQTTKVVRGVGTSWSPRVIRIASGTTIRWKAVSNSHTVTAYGGHWTFNRSLPQGSSIERRFKTQGTFLFRCRIHSQLVNGVCQGMCGKVVVGAPTGSVEVATGTASGVGTVLVDGTGLTLYELETEANGQIMCTGACRSTWPPLLLPEGVTSATPGPGVTGTLGTITRPEGGTQVTYDGRPLYLYSGDQTPGQANGQGIQGVWFAMTPSGPSGGGTSPPPPRPHTHDLTTRCLLQASGEGASDARDEVIPPLAEGHVRTVARRIPGRCCPGHGMTDPSRRQRRRSVHGRSRAHPTGAPDPQVQPYSTLRTPRDRAPIGAP